MNGERTLTLIACGALAALLAPWPAAWAQTPAKPPAKPAAEPILRMFFTPAQRASLDIARTRRARATLSTERVEEVQTAAPVAQTVTVDGILRRSDGKSTIWINNRPFNETEQAGGPVVGRIRPDGSVLLQMPQTGRSVELKVGQTIELLSGQIEEPYSRKPVATTPEAKPAAKPAPKPATDAKGARPPSPEELARAERDREDRDQQRLQEAIRGVQDATGAKPGAASAPPPEGPAR